MAGENSPYGLNGVLAIAGADLTGTGLAVPPVHTRLTPGGGLADPALRDRITRLIGDRPGPARRRPVLPA